MFIVICFFKQKTAYEMRISDWSSDVCSSDLQQFTFYGRVADDVQKLLMAPYIAFQRRDIEVAAQNGGLVELRGPSDPSLQEIDLLPEFGILSPVRNLATPPNINAFKTNDIVQPHTSVAPLHIRLPIVAIIHAERKIGRAQV